MYSGNMATTDGKVSLERLRDVLRYEPGTGKFFWTRMHRGVRRPEAGTLKSGYVQLSIDHITFKAHRLAWLYCHERWPKGDIDHIDGDRSNNRISNLREISRAGNLQNLRKPRGNKHGVLGVHCNGDRFMAMICVNYKKIYLGTYDTIEQAAQAYLEGKRRLHIGCTI
jgi:hypothetical protein